MKILVLISMLSFGLSQMTCSKTTTTSVDDTTVKTAATTAKTAVSTDATTKKMSYGIGDIATDFSLKNIDDKMVSLSDFDAAKGFILTFTCNHCPYAVMYEDRLIALDKKYKELGYPVIAINPNNPEAKPDDSFEKMKVRAAEKGFTFPYLMDEGQKIYPQYGATKTPHMYVLRKTDAGHVVEYIGAIDDSPRDEAEVEERYIESVVDALLKGEEPPVRKTKAIGCSIKV